MDKENSVLEHIAVDEQSTQREISKNIGLSLGAVNLVLGNCAKKGLLKVEKLSARSIKYLLTPKGFRELSVRSYNHLQRSFDNYKNLKEILSEITKEKNKISLLGSNDVIYHMIELVFKELNFKSYKRYTNILDIDKETHIICWEADYHETLEKKKLKHDFILEKMWHK